jgi:Low affinity iron permease
VASPRTCLIFHVRCPSRNRTGPSRTGGQRQTRASRGGHWHWEGRQTSGVARCFFHQNRSLCSMTASRAAICQGRSSEYGMGNSGWSTTVYNLMHEPKRVWHFHDWARHASMLTGTPTTFFIACAIVIAWTVTGPLFGFSDTWQLVINTGTTIVTFLIGSCCKTRRTATRALSTLSLTSCLGA